MKNHPPQCNAHFNTNKTIMIDHKVKHSKNFGRHLRCDYFRKIPFWSYWRTLCKLCTAPSKVNLCEWKHLTIDSRDAPYYFHTTKPKFIEHFIAVEDLPNYEDFLSCSKNGKIERFCFLTGIIYQVWFHWKRTLYLRGTTWKLMEEMPRNILIPRNLCLLGGDAKFKKPGFIPGTIGSYLLKQNAQRLYVYK